MYKLILRSILLLHCNYDNGLIEQESSLNLSKEKAEDLLQYFQYVFIGHEHISRVELGGRLIVVGNLHPTSFSDISDKYYWIWDSVTNQLEKHLIWSQEEGYCLLSPDQLDAIPEGVQFIDIQGEVSQAEMPAYAKRISELWDKYPNLLMVRNGLEAQHEEIEAAPLEYVSLPDQISLDLSDTPLFPLWKNYLAKLEA